MRKKKNKIIQQKEFTSESEITVGAQGQPENIPPTGPMKGNPVFYGKEVGVKPNQKLKKKLEKDSHDITDETVAQSAEEDKHE